MNGILLVSYYNQTRATGLAALPAMYHAAEERMRSIMMTALSACIGLLPAAVSHGIGSQVQRPLAVVVVGGMLVAPIMMLIVVPALATLFEPDADLFEHHDRDETPQPAGGPL